MSDNKANIRISKVKSYTNTRQGSSISTLRTFNLMYIQKGTTVINIKVPYVWQGAIVSIAGIILSVVWVIALGKTGKSGKNKR